MRSRNLNIPLASPKRYEWHVIQNAIRRATNLLLLFSILGGKYNDPRLLHVFTLVNLITTINNKPVEY
jgi:hypothetical protein